MWHAKRLWIFQTKVDTLCLFKKGAYLWVRLKFESIILNAFAPERLSPVEEKKEEEKKDD